MVIWNFILEGVALYLCFVIVSAVPRFNMGCDCGIRPFSKEVEEDCKKSAQLEAPEAQETSIIKDVHCINPIKVGGGGGGGSLGP